MEIDLNELAREITLEEGLKESVNIAQVKEVMKIFLKKLAKIYVEEPLDIAMLLDKYVEE